jgi:hypothetical protein
LKLFSILENYSNLEEFNSVDTTGTINNTKKKLKSKNIKESSQSFPNKKEINKYYNSKFS